MASGSFNYLNKKWLDATYGATSFAGTGTIYFGLSTAAFDKTKTGATIAEAAYTSYARVAVTNNATHFPAATGTGTATKTGDNTGAITWPQNTGTAETENSAFIADVTTLGAGNLYHGADITALVINALDTPQINTNGFTATQG